jgi:hypothetical protein
MDGALAQLGERLHGMQEVSGSIPLGSTIHDEFEYLKDTLADEVSSAGVFGVWSSKAHVRRAVRSAR